MAENGRLISTDLLHKLRVEILIGRMRSGEKLTEQDICAAFGVSRTPVREALKNLDAEGLIEMIPNRGAFVIGLNEDDIQDLYTIRIQNEMQAVRWAIARRTDAEMEAIEESLDFMRFYTERGDVKRIRTINMDFHKRIATAAHNRILAENLSRILDYIMYSAYVHNYHESELAVILKEHRSIYSGFRNNDPESGAAAIKKHIENSKKRAKV